MSDVTDLKKYRRGKIKSKFAVYEFYWGAAVKNTETNQWIKAFLTDGTEIDYENIPFIVHRNGIEFLGGGSNE